MIKEVRDFTEKHPYVTASIMVAATSLLVKLIHDYQAYQSQVVLKERLSKAGMFALKRTPVGNAVVMASKMLFK